MFLDVLIPEGAIKNGNLWHVGSFESFGLLPLTVGAAIREYLGSLVLFFYGFVVNTSIEG